MSDLTITNAGVAVSANSAGSSISTGRRKIIRVTPTLDTSAYAVEMFCLMVQKYKMQ